MLRSAGGNAFAASSEFSRALEVRGARRSSPGWAHAAGAPLIQGIRECNRYQAYYSYYWTIALLVISIFAINNIIAPSLRFIFAYCDYSHHRSRSHHYHAILVRNPHTFYLYLRLPYA